MRSMEDLPFLFPPKTNVSDAVQPEVPKHVLGFVEPRRRDKSPILALATYIHPQLVPELAFAVSVVGSLSLIRRRCPRHEISPTSFNLYARLSTRHQVEASSTNQQDAHPMAVCLHTALARANERFEAHLSVDAPRG